VPDRSAKDALTNPSLQKENEIARLVALESRLDLLLISTDYASPIFPPSTAIERDPGSAAGGSGAFSTKQTQSTTCLPMKLTTSGRPNQN
jgi:hypothetical protein